MLNIPEDTLFEKVWLITKPIDGITLLKDNRKTTRNHINRIKNAILRGEWIPPVFISESFEILDGQHRYIAFCEVYTEYPSSCSTIRVLEVKNHESSSNIALILNSHQKNWNINDYMHHFLINKTESYVILQNFVNENPKLEYKAALQLIKGSSIPSVFKEGKLEISDQEIQLAKAMIIDLNYIFLKTNIDIIYRRDIIKAFRSIYPEIKNMDIFINNLKSTFLWPKGEKYSDWVKAYSTCI